MTLLVGLAASAGAVDRRLCTAALVTEGLCPDTTVDILSVVGLPADMDDLIEAMAKLGSWTATITCNQAAIDAAYCTNPQRGDEITNPLSEEDAGLEFFVSILKETIVEWRVRKAELEAAQLVDTDPDIE